MIGSHVTLRSDDPAIGVVVGHVMRSAPAVLFDTATGLEVPGCKYLIQPDDGGEAVWSPAFRVPVADTDPVCGDCQEPEWSCSCEGFGPEVA